jgi:hypothetical protein
VVVGEVPVVSVVVEFGDVVEVVGLDEVVVGGRTGFGELVFNPK